jgi:quercetin dioxygenase-like cupin family protein
MTDSSKQTWQWISSLETMDEFLPDRTHHFYTHPNHTPNSNIITVRAIFPAGSAHKFHSHPNMEEVIYIVHGTCEQWVEDDMQLMLEGDSVHIPAGTVHGSYNAGDDDLVLLAILTPADADGPHTVDHYKEEPYASLPAGQTSAGF